MAVVAGTRLGRYEIRSPLGAGGMGEVYLAEDTRLHRKVALKILPAEVASNSERMRRFVQEAKAASALNHPNIITIYEIDEGGGSPTPGSPAGQPGWGGAVREGVHFIATEFIDGQTLRQRMRGAPMKLGEVLDVATQAASALSAAHAAGIIHRDIKPENVMLRRDGIVKVLDFGLAKLTEQVPPDAVDTEAPTRVLVNTDTGVVMGTAIYMSPEQARGLQVDARTDIFSLGVLIYEMVAGRLPFEGSNKYEILASILSDKEPPPLTRYVREVPAELERIVEKALRKDREQRYQTAKDMLLDLKRFKQRLEVDAEIERTLPPEKFGVPPSGGQLKEGKSLPPEASPSLTHPTLSAEYIITGIKQHKLAAVIAIVVLALGIVGLAVYLHARNTEVAIDSIAVLPFANQNNDPNMDYLSDGIPESIINSLSQLPNLKVMSRNSVFHFKGKDMDAQMVRGYIAHIEGRRKAEEYARKALELDENLAEAHVALGLAYVVLAPSNLSLGDRELRRGIELSPSLALAHQFLVTSLARQGRLDESVEEQLKARELDPLSPIIARLVVLPYYLKRDYVRALELLGQANELGPAFTFSLGNRSVRSKPVVQRSAGGIGEGQTREERRPDFDLQYGHGLCGAGEACRSAPDHQRVGGDVGAKSRPGAVYCKNLCGLEREGTGLDMVRTWLGRGRDRSLL